MIMMVVAIVVMMVVMCGSVQIIGRRLVAS